MNRAIIANLAIEIVSMVLIILVTIPIWHGFQINEMRELAEFYDDLYYISYNIEDNDTNKIITLDNMTYTKENYNLVMVLDENNLEEDLIIDVNGISKSINDFEMVNKDNKDYIILDKSDLTAETKVYDIKSNKNIDYKLDVVENI